MDDSKIIEMYFQKNQKAITETDKKYGKMLHTIAYNILFDISESQECVNDTYLNVWNKIPPTNPKSFKAFIARIIRYISIDRLRKNTADKRNSEYTRSLDELSEVVSGNESLEENAIEKELIEAINKFLSSLSEKHCDMFVMRYFYADSIKDIAKFTGKTVSNVKTTLFRIRKDLLDYLKKEGFEI